MVIEAYPDWVSGDQLGLLFPTSIRALVEQGPEFLTAAFQRAGTLSPDNRVVAVTRSTEFVGGGMGRKLLLSVQYRKPADALHSNLFVKFPRDFGDPLRDLFGPLMEPEVRFALLSRRDDFPIAVPKCYFADYHAVSRSGLLITERIAYAEGAIEPHLEKCLDYELSDPSGHYRALTTAIARLAGFHRAGKFGSQTERQFPFDPTRIDVGSRIPYSPAQLGAKLDKLRSFAAAYPQLFPGSLGSADFLERFSQQAPLVLEHEIAIRTYLNQSSDCIALCHWNLNLDNAWFWSAPGEPLQAGLLDWGSVGQMNLAQAFYGMICAAETDFLNAHKQELLALLVAEYARYGGPRLDLEEIDFMVKLAVAVLGIAWILDAPALVEAQIPELHRLSSRYDPRLRNDFLARAQLQLLVVLLNEWQAGEIGSALRRFTGAT
jgi:hypothetical protein